MNSTAVDPVATRPRAENAARAGATPHGGGADAASARATPNAPPRWRPAHRAERRPQSAVAWFRAALVVGAVAAAVVAGLVAAGSARSLDPDLATLLRGMAAIKGLLAALAAGLVWWRLGQPASPGVALTYVGCAGVLCGSTVLIWQLAFIPAAAVLFHAAALVGAVVALREERATSGAGRRALAASAGRSAAR